jgi:EAL domain-containing protein (putative c-di-GMP-specific phosphodiesterase class I)
LVVEDEPGVAILVARIARDCGYQVTSVASVEAFREMISLVRPSLLLVDLKLGGGDGVDVLAHLASTNPTVPVMVFTGYGDRALNSSAQLAECLGLTVAGVFSKPLDMARFRGTLQSRAGGYGARARRVPDGVPSRARLLKNAISRGEIIPYYQPQIDVVSDRVVGAEILARWRQPGGAVLSPDDFIGLAESSDLILDLTLTLLDKALADAAVWRDAGHDLSIAMNVPSRLLEVADFPLAVEASLARRRADPRKLVLEITESAPVADRAQALEIITRLCLQQVVLSLDDLGTEHSCLSMMHRLPLSEAKIDRQFVTDLATAPDSQSIVTAIICMAHDLGLRIVAEGVEDAATVEFLRRAGADVAQGFFYSRPRPAASFSTWLQARQENSAGG